MKEGQAMNQTNLFKPESELNNSTMGERSSSLNILSFSFLLMIMFMTLFGNTLVILAFKKNSKIRTVTNYFVVSLAVADILVAITSMPIWAAYPLLGARLKESILKIWTFMDILCGVASITNLTAISIERYVCIAYPFDYQITVTSRKAIPILIIIWLFSVLMSSLKIVLWEVPPPKYELAVVISCFFMPLLIMCIFYTCIFRTVRFQIRQISLATNVNMKRFRLASELRAAKTIAVVIGAFVVCWGPFFILNTVYGFCNGCVPEVTIVVAKWMHYTNSVLNPILYACMHKEFRKAFFVTLLGRKRVFRRRGMEKSSSNGTELVQF